MRLQGQANVGRFDQILRLGIGAAMLWVGFIDTSYIDDRFVAAIVGVFGLLNIVAATVRVCPFYNLAGINTNNQDD